MHRVIRRLPFTTLTACALSMVIAGCSGSGDPLIGLDFREADSGRETTARDHSPGGGMWINNGLSSPMIGGIDPAYALSTPQGMSETSGVLTDLQTRIAAEYLVECALPEGASIDKVVDGEPLTFEGSLGLAPEWEDGDCDEDCQQWVTACMLARTNVSAETIWISVRATHPAIGLARRPSFDVYESSFFGNMFADPEAQYMCAGTQSQAAQASLAGRTCSSDPEACGFVSYEDCEGTARCTFLEEQGDLIASDCLAEGDPAPFHTISVYLHPADLEDEDEDDDD